MPSVQRVIHQYNESKIFHRPSPHAIDSHVGSMAEAPTNSAPTLPAGNQKRWNEGPSFREILDLNLKSSATSSANKSRQ